MRQFLRCWWLNTWKIMTVIDYCMNENNNDSYSCGGELYYKSQQPFSALIIFCMMANYTLLNMFFTLSDIVIRLKKSTIPDWYPSRKSKVSTMNYNSICTSSSNVDLIKLGFSATEPVWALIPRNLPREHAVRNPSFIIAIDLWSYKGGKGCYC